MEATVEPGGATPANARAAQDAPAGPLDPGTGVTLPDGETLLTPDAAAALLGMSRSHLMAFMAAGVLTVQAGPEHYITESALSDFAARREAAGEFLANPAPVEARTLAKLAPVTLEALRELDNL